VNRITPRVERFAVIGASGGGPLWLRRNDGHVSILAACPLAMDWLPAQQ
jgi:hypothetical protein